MDGFGTFVYREADKKGRKVPKLVGLGLLLRIIGLLEKKNRND